VIRVSGPGYRRPVAPPVNSVHRLARAGTAQVLTAELGEPLAAFVTYDKRLLTTAQTAGFTTASPGA
jgi:uncharacterized protein